MAASPAFELNHSTLGADRRFADIAETLTELSPIASEESFNHYCREACRLWSGQFRKPVGQTSDQFTNLLAQIERRSQQVIKTDWGGIVITRHEHPQSEKWLVIGEGSYLALEKHEQKDERLEVKEGAGLIVWRRMADQPLAVQPPRSGRRVSFRAWQGALPDRH
jgi:hypothetical protein